VADYSYAQLEGLWINAGGPKNLAPTAAAIAEAESGGNSDARNPSGASGLWQILGNPFPGNPFDPATNARMAVAKWREAPDGGQNFSPWVTFTSGAYKAYMSNGTSPDSNVPGSPSSVQAAAAAGSQADCLVPNPISLPVVGTLGPGCLFTRSNARAFIGAGLLFTGGAVAVAGLVVLAAAASLKAAGPMGGVAEGVGGALMLVPGAEAAGAAVAAAGAKAKSTSRGPGAAARRTRSAGAREDAAAERRLGQPRENPALEARGGTVRQDRAQRAAQRARQRSLAADEPPF
jgi:hypothetical protein